MKYRTEQIPLEFEGTRFSRYRKKYRLDKAKNRLIQDGVDDIQEQIDSYKDYTLDSLLDTFLPERAPDNAEYVTLSNTLTDKLDQYRELTDKAEFYREKLGLPEGSSLSAIFKSVQEHSDDLSEYLKSVYNEKNNPIVKEEVKDDEKENKQEKE